MYFKTCMEGYRSYLHISNPNFIFVQIQNNILMLIKIHWMGIQIQILQKSVPILLTSH